MGSISELPTVDFTLFRESNDLSTRKRVAAKLADALHIHGAVGVTGHGVPAEKLKEAFEMARKLFDLSMEDKMKAPHPDGFVPHRGYSPPGKEKAYNKDELESDSLEVKESQRKITDFKPHKSSDPAASGTLTSFSVSVRFERSNEAFEDDKEHYEIGSEKNEVHYNIWLPEEVLPGYRAYETQLFWYLQQVSMTFMDALLLGLEADEKEGAQFKDLHSGHDSILRLLHYPQIAEEKLQREVLARCPAHQDLTTFTILFQDDASGLEFEDNTNKGLFLPATPAEGKIYLNTGDMFEIFSNGYYPSAMHRVSIPEKPGSASDTTPERYSMPFFIIPENNAAIQPQSTGRPGQMPSGKFSGKSWNEQAAFITKWQYEKEK